MTDEEISAAVLDHVFETILARQQDLPEGSYVTHLLRGGVDRTARKVGEEAVEVVLAAKNEATAELIAEVADLWFHCLVLMAQNGVAPADIFRELAGRHGRPASYQVKADAQARLPSSQDV